MTDTSTGTAKAAKSKKKLIPSAIILAVALVVAGGWGIKTSWDRAEAAAAAELAAQAERRAQERDLTLARSSAQEALERAEVREVHALEEYIPAGEYAAFTSLEADLQIALQKHVRYSTEGVEVLRTDAGEFTNVTDRLVVVGMNEMYDAMVAAHLEALKLWNETHETMDRESHEELREVVAGRPSEQRDYRMTRQDIQEMLTRYANAIADAEAARDAWLESQSRDEEAVATVSGSNATKPAPSTGGGSKPAPSNPKPTQTSKPAPAPKPAPQPTPTAKPTPKPTPPPAPKPSALDQAKIALQYATTPYVASKCVLFAYQEGDGGWGPGLWAQARAKEFPKVAFTATGNDSWARASAYSCE